MRANFSLVVPRNRMPKLKESVIATAKAVVAQVLLATIEDCAEVTFDKKQLAPEEIDFLKNTALSEISFENINDPEKFLIRNKESGAVMAVSNRAVANNELRGHLVRAIISEAQVATPTQSLYDTLNHALNNPKTSGILAKSKGFFVGLKFSPYEQGEIMEENHFVLFTQVLLNILDQKKKEGRLDGVTYKDVLKKENDVRDHIWDGVDLDEIYEVTKEIGVQFKQFSSKAEDLEKRGYKAEAGIARQLATDLEGKQTLLKTGDISLSGFFTEGITLIEAAQQTTLIDLRGFGKIFNDLVNRLITMLNYLGANLPAVVREPDSATKLTATKANLSFFKEMTLPNQENDEVAPHQVQDFVAR